MPTTQTTLTDDPDDPGDARTTDDTHTNATPTEPDDSAVLAPPDQRGGERCCPWCLAAPETFEHHDTGRPRCGYCDAAIPVGVPWFERGEKIVL